jgi:tetratricopeptide (TPR) repeat protein
MSGRFAVTAVAIVWLAGSPVSAQTQPNTPARPMAPGAQGKIVLIQGHVDSAVSTNQDQWNPARLFQPLFVSDRLRTLTASRSAILFIDETQVKLNAGAVLTVQQIKTAAGTSTTLGLLEGEGWFRTKNPQSGLVIKTPRAAAAIRGTEIDIIVRGNDAVLTVTEGAAEFSNDAGAIRVNAGEEATATPGQVPTKRTLLNPEDAVQWVLYYPSRIAWHDLPAAAQAGPARGGFDRLKAGDAAGALAAFQPNVAGDPWSRVGAAMALRQLGDPTGARAMASGDTLTGDLETERRVELAAAALATGDARTARAELDAAVAAAPTALRPLVALSELELTQNRKTEATALAQRAIAAHPDSVAAHVAAAEAVQAAFDLSTARRELDAALALDASDVRALVDRARIRFGVGDTAGAREDAARAAARAPDDAQLRSLVGFVKLAGGDVRGARVDFEAAVGNDAALGEPHLGLGLLDFRGALYDEGLLEMLTATLLEPKVSLYQSYLGKAYYQLKRFPEGLAALASAKHLDPRDPTPWLYASFFLRDLNRQVDALEELRHAIALNDNRAVYRSRLLLDRDQATKNVSLARLYNELGFEAWGAYEALNSLNADLTNASAHLFMADTYGNLPDRTQAFGSELDQYFLYSPVNLNSFNNFSEYTSLLERPLKEVTVTQAGGNVGYASTTFRTRSGNERFAHTAFIDYYRREGARLGASDYRVQGTAEMKVAFGDSTDLFLTLTGVKQVKGKDNDSEVLVGRVPYAVVVTQIVPHPDPTFTHRGDFAEATLGFKHMWRPGSAATFKANVDHIGSIDEDPDATTAACTDSALTQVIGTDLSVIGGRSNSRITTPFSGVSLQGQQATRLGRHQLIVGADYSRRRKTFGCHDSVTSAFFQGAFTVDQGFHAIERSAGAYVRDEIDVARRLHATIGARYVDGLYQDPLQSVPDFAFTRWDPYAGVSVRVSPVTVVHAAAFRNTNSDFISSRISPPTVAGFVFERNELPTAQRDEGGVAVQNTWARSFVEVRAFVRRTRAPAFQIVPPELAQFAKLLTPPDADFKSRGAAVFFNRIVTRRISVFADDQFIHREPFLFERDDNQVRVGANYIHPRGLFARISTRFITQRFRNTPVDGLPQSTYPLTDTELNYDFAHKHGLLTWTITNLFDRQFQTVIEGVSVEAPLPYRRMIVSLRWRP